MSSWPACRVCKAPVEIDDAEAVRRTHLERSMEAVDPGWRLPADLHRGDCLKAEAIDRMRAALRGDRLAADDNGARTPEGAAQ